MEDLCMELTPHKGVRQNMDRLTPLNQVTINLQFVIHTLIYYLLFFNFLCLRSELLINYIIIPNIFLLIL